MSFEWISNNIFGESYITVDSQLRFYISSGARDVMRLGKKLPAKLIVGYDIVNKRLIFAKPEVVRAANIKPFSFDRRSYSSARSFIKKVGIPTNELPQTYVYIGKEYGEYPEGAFAFQLEDFDAPDAN